MAAVLVVVACGEKQQEQQKLPRASAEEMAAYAPEFDKVFHDVYSFSTNELHSLIVVKDGKVIYEHYEPGHEPDVLHIMWSATKTFTATAIGFAIQEGLLSVDDKVISFFKEDELPAEPCEWLQQLTIDNLLCMSSGFVSIYAGIAERGVDYDWAKTQLNRPMDFEPGTRYRYDSFNSHLLSVIISRVTGQTAEEYLKPRLFDPLGITEYHWEKDPQGNSCGGWGLYLYPESFAKMGQFLLQKGMWNGKQLLSADWVEESSRCQILQYEGEELTPEKLEAYSTDDRKQGYCYQMWRGRNNSFRLDGAHGQYTIICPDKNLVISCFSETANTALLRESIWNHIYNNVYKAMVIDFDTIEEKAFPAFKGGEKQLDAKMFFDGQNRIMRARLVPGASIGMHTHDTSSEIMFITEGCGSVIFDGEKIALKAGDVHYCPKGHTHSLINDSNADLCFSAVVPQQ